LFWGNIPDLTSNVGKVHAKKKNYLIRVLNGNLLLKNLYPLTTNSSPLSQGKKVTYPVEIEGDKEMKLIRVLERVFGSPTHYIDVGNLAISKRQQLSATPPWSIPVVKWFFVQLRNYFKCGKKSGGCRRVKRLFKFTLILGILQSVSGNIFQAHPLGVYLWV
jgi:hypothetical protein